MKARKLWEFPAPSTAIISSGVRFIHTGCDLFLLFDYYCREKDGIFNSGLVIEGVQSFRHTCEKFLESESAVNVDTMFQAYDNLVEYCDS